MAEVECQLQRDLHRADFTHTVAVINGQSLSLVVTGPCRWSPPQHITKGNVPEVLMTQGQTSEYVI